MKKNLLLLMVAATCNFVYTQNIGIGTNTPSASAQLDVSSTTKGLLIPRMTTLQRTAIVSPANGLMVYDTNLSAFYFYNGTAWAAVNSGGGVSNNWAASGNNIFNNNTGNVGIGASTGLKEKLSVKGDIFVSFANPNDLVNGGNRAEINLHGSSTGGGRINFLNADTTVGAHINYYRLTNTVNQFSFNHGSNTHQLSLHNNGNVGIGLSAPLEKLDVDGSIRSREDLLSDGKVIADGIVSGSGLSTPGNLAVQGIGYIAGNVTTNQNLSVGGTSSFQGAVSGSSSASFTGAVNSNAEMNINNNSGILNFKSSGVDKVFVQLSGDDLRVGTFSGNSTGGFIVRTNGANRMVVNNLGNVGIGTTTPGSTLHVQGRGLFRGAGEVITVDGTSNPNIGFYNNGTFKSFISQTPTNLVIGVNGGALQLDATQIAIGAVIPAASGYKLTVTGKVICEELKVQLQGAWPDYVFQEKYNLMPMDELRNFINSNNHLPNIPAAAAIEKNGMEVGEMQRKMMEKIEELTLYILQLEEKINASSRK